MEAFNSVATFAKTVPHLFLWGIATGVVGVGVVTFLLRWAKSIVVITIFIVIFSLFTN